MKLYFYVSRPLREGQFPFSLLPTRSARFACARLTLLLSLIFAIFSPVLSQQPSKQNSLESVPTAEFARMVRADLARWTPIVKASGFTAED